MDALLGPEMEKMSKIYAKINAAARRAPPSGKEPIRDQVHARLALATLGTEMAAITSALSGIFPSAPLLNPPIATGMVDTVEKIHGTLMKHGAISQAEMKEMSACFERLRHLLRVYYDAKLSGRKTMEFRFCDMKDVNTIGLKLHEVGVFLQLSPERLRAFLDASPSIESWLLDAPLDIGKWRRETEAAQRAVKEDPEADDDDRMRVSDMDQKSQADCTAYQLAFFVGDILVALLLNPAHDERDQERADKAMTRLVEMSTKPVYRNTYGDPLTDAMRPVYWTPKLLVRFSHAGGLPALVGDWAMSTAKDGICKEAMETLPRKAWDNQTPESLLGIMRELNYKTEVDGDDFVTTPVFANIMHQIYSRYGIAPFERASTLSDSMILFYFIHRRLSKRLQKVNSVADWLSLLRKYSDVPRATRRRHGWMILTVSGRWDCLDMYGCANPECPEKRELLKLKERRRRGHRDPAIEERLYRWGGESKACSRCKHVSYCGAECQKAHWKSHQRECKMEAAKNKTEEI